MLKDPLYIGLRHKRIRGQAYDDLLDEFMEAVTSRYVIYLCYSVVNSAVNLGEIKVSSLWKEDRVVGFLIIFVLTIVLYTFIIA